MTKRLGFSTDGQTWATYEAGRIPPHPTVQKIAQVFGFPILWIYDGREDQLNLEQADIVRRGEIRLEEGWRPRRKKRSNSAN